MERNRDLFRLRLLKLEVEKQLMNDNTFQPDIVAFCCRHCAYAAADLAGSMRLDYPMAVKLIELPCTGKLDVLYVLRAFEDGADGVMVAG